MYVMSFLKYNTDRAMSDAQRRHNCLKSKFDRNSKEFDQKLLIADANHAISRYIV